MLASVLLDASSALGRQSCKAAFGSTGPSLHIGGTSQHPLTTLIESLTRLRRRACIAQTIITTCTLSPRAATMLPVTRTASSTLSRLGSYLRLTLQAPVVMCSVAAALAQPLLETLRIVKAVEPVERDADL